MDYKNGKIYTIRSHQTDDVYYGSTTQPLSKRLSKHKSNYNGWKKGKNNYVTSFKIIEYDDCYIELYENYPCESKIELHRREGEIIRANNDAVNRCIAGRTYKEYYHDNKDKMKEYNGNSYKKHSEKRKAYQKEYNINNSDKVKQRNAKYYNEHKEDNKKRRAKYWQENKDRFEKTRSEKFDCPCGGKYSYTSKTKHFRTEKHKAYLEANK